MRLARLRSRLAAAAISPSASLRRWRCHARSAESTGRRRSTPAGGLLELGDACPRLVSDALRLGLGAAGGVQLVGEVLGVSADALAKLRELGLEFRDGRARDDGWLGVRGLEVGWAAVAFGVDAVQREVLVVAATHGGLEALERGSLVAQSTRPARGDLGAVELAVGRGVEEEQLGGFSRARERGVGPVAREVLRATDDARPLHGGALDGVRGQHVGVLQMLSHIGGIKAALGAGVGAHEHVLLGRVDRDDRGAHAVIDRPLTVVATRDDAIPHGELVASDVDALAEPVVALQLGADNALRRSRRSLSRTISTACPHGHAAWRSRHAAIAACSPHVRVHIAGVDLQLPAGRLLSG